ARDYLKMAAEQGHAEAIELLEEVGDHEPAPPPPDLNKDLEKAIAGDQQSQYKYAFASYMGMGVPRDLNASYFWFKVLSRTMPPQAEQMLQLLSPYIPEDVRAKLDEHAGQWTPGA